MAKSKISQNIKKSDLVVKVGDNILSVEVKSPKVSTGESLDKLVKNIKKTSKANIFKKELYESVKISD